LQEKEYKLFKEQQKQELKLLRQELDLDQKKDKKEVLKKRKDQKDIELQEKVAPEFNSLSNYITISVLHIGFFYVIILVLQINTL
jgi:hypothetical protein